MIRYFYSGPIFAVTEPDGVRLMSPEVCDLVQKVPGGCNVCNVPNFPKNIKHIFPASTVSVFRPGSTSPSAMLYDAWESFSQRSPKADESIRSIRPELASAVNECIDAAGHEWEPYWQRRLMNVR